MNRSFFAVVGSFLLAGQVATADSDRIYSAFDTITNSQSGAEIADGLIKVGQSLNDMSVDETIAFRTSLALLGSSGRVEKDTASWRMLDTLWKATNQHLLTTCATTPTPEVVGAVRMQLGRSANHCRLTD